MKNLFIISSLLLIQLNSYAIEPQPPQTIAPGKVNITVVHYSPNQITELNTSLEYVTTVEFSPEENITAVAIGNTSNWQVTPFQNKLFIKPTSSVAKNTHSTNMTVITNKRNYYFIVNLNNSKSLNFILRFDYSPYKRTSSSNAAQNNTRIPIPEIKKPEIKKPNAELSKNKTKIEAQPAPHTVYTPPPRNSSYSYKPNSQQPTRTPPPSPPPRNSSYSYKPNSQQPMRTPPPSPPPRNSSYSYKPNSQQPMRTPPPPAYKPEPANSNFSAREYGNYNANGTDKKANTPKIPEKTKHNKVDNEYTANFPIENSYYKISKNSKILVENVYDSEGKTFFKFSTGQSIPKIFYISDEKLEVPLEVTLLANNVVSVDKIDKKFTLRLSDDITCILNDKLINPELYKIPEKPQKNPKKRIKHKKN